MVKPAETIFRESRVFNTSKIIIPKDIKIDLSIFFRIIFMEKVEAKKTTFRTT